MKNCFIASEKRDVVSQLNWSKFPGLQPPRIMDKHYFIYMLEGGWSIGRGSTEYKLLPDDVIVIPAGGDQYAVSASVLPIKYIWILASASDEDCCSDEITDDPKYISIDTKMSCCGYEEPKRLFQKIAYESSIKNQHSDVKLISLFNVLLCELSEIKKNNVNDKSNSLFNSITAHINSNLDYFYTLNDFANMYSISEKTIRNIFLKNTKKSFNEYQKILKIELIKTRLQIEPGIKMRIVAKEYGFCDEFNMSKIFKKYTGVSPTEYKLSIQS